MMTVDSHCLCPVELASEGEDRHCTVVSLVCTTVLSHKEYKKDIHQKITQTSTIKIGTKLGALT